MKDRFKLISRFETLCGILRNTLVPEIKLFVMKNGKARPKGQNETVLTFDGNLKELSDELIPMVEVETDRHTGDMGYKPVDSLTFSFETNTLYIETQSNTVSEQEISIQDIIAIYETLFTLDEGQLDDDVEIKDGCIQPKDTE